MNRLKRIEFEAINKDRIIKKIQEIAFEILEVDNKNEIAMNQLVKCYTMQKEFEIARIYGDNILGTNPNNIFVLYNMTKLELKAGNIQKASEYNMRLLQIDENNKQGNIQKNIIEERIEQQRRKQEIIDRSKAKERRQREIEGKIKQIELKERKELERIKKKRSMEEEQKSYGKEKIKEEKYTVENQKEYIETITKMFIEGKINTKNIEKVKEEINKYPNKTESSLFLSEIYYAITEKEEKGIEQINECIDTAQSLSREEYKTLDEKISEFRKRIDLKEYLSKKEEQQKLKNKELKREQRDYSRQIIERIDKGKIKKEDVPEIIRNLEKYPDRTKAIFLITKLYEGFYGANETLQLLNKYGAISNLTEEEKNSIVKMKEIVVKNRKINTIKQRQQKVRKRKKESKNYKRTKESGIKTIYTIKPNNEEKKILETELEER